MKKNSTNTATTLINLLTGLFRAPATFAVVFAVAIGCCAAFNVNAATYTVTTTADAGAGSLRQAVANANDFTDADTIVFDATVFAAPQTIVLSSGELPIAYPVTIKGTGANRLTIQNTAADSRVFLIFTQNSTVNLTGMKITGGNISSSGGGGLFIGGSGTMVNITSCWITGNTTTGNGGGIRISDGTVNLTNSTVSNNTSSRSRGGGGIDSSGTLTVTNSTVSGNQMTSTNVANGGGMYVDGITTIINSTITGNSVGGNNGASGIYRDGVFNNATTIKNTIIAANVGNTSAPDTRGAFTSNGYNLIGNVGAATGFTGTGDQTGTSGAPLDPLLDALANYGGTVPTHRLQTGSPAIDNGAPGTRLDQRGVVRPFDNPLIANATSGNGADIGAFELQTSIVKDWGFNQSGQLGLGSFGSQTTPQTVSGFNDITGFGGGFLHSVALRSNGTVATAGNDQYGQLGDGTIGGGSRTTFGAVINLTNITAVSGGYQHSLALRPDGTVWAWGSNFNGELGNGANADRATPVQVGAGIAAFNTHVVAVSAGSYHNLALTDDGKVWAWGYNGYGELGDGTTTKRNVPVQVKAVAGGAQLSNVEQISAGEYHSVALKSDGTALVWGYNGDGEVGNGTTNPTGCQCVQYPAQTTATLMGTVVQISAGQYHTVAVNTLGDVYAWGDGSVGEIGDGTTTNRSMPVQVGVGVAGFNNIVRVEAHDASHTIARRRDGTLFVWGYNVAGQISNGTATDQTTPLDISAAAGAGGNLGTNIAVFGAGYASSFAATLPEMATPAGAGTLRGDQFSIAFPASTTAGQTQVRTFDPTATGLTAPAGYTILANSTGYDITSTANPAGGAALVCLKVPNVIDSATFNQLYILHDDDGDGAFDAVGNTRDYQRREICRPTNSFSPFVLAQSAVAPTAAQVSIAGRVTMPQELGLTNALVTLTDMRGESRTVLTGKFGSFRFTNVTAGKTYIVTVTSKRYTYAPQIVTAFEDLTEVNFTAQ